MEAINNSFYIISDKIVELQGFFLNVANKIAYIILLIAICTAAINYALTGTGFKENVVKIGKAFVFFSLVLFAYPSIVGWIIDMTFTLAKDSTASGISSNIRLSQKEMADLAEQKELDNEKWTYGTMALRKYDNYFSGMLGSRTFTDAQGKNYTYTTVAPAYAMKSITIIAGECLRLTENFSLLNPGLGKSLLNLLMGYSCAFFVIVIGIFCVLEYLIAFFEFLFVSSVGVILFPMSLWDGTKFIAEKYIGAILGFFVKLLFCTICIFLMLYVFTSLSNNFTKEPFTGQIEQIATFYFSTLLIFYICKSAPALAQGFLSGSPSLSAAGAIGMVASAVAAVAHLGGGGSGLGMVGAQIPSAQTSSSISSGSGSVSAAISSQPPPQVFSAQQEAPSYYYSAPLPDGRPYAAIEGRQSDLTRSLAYTNRPLIGGRSVGQAAMLPPPPSYQPGPRRDPDFTYEAIG